MLIYFYKESICFWSFSLDLVELIFESINFFEWYCDFPFDVSQLMKFIFLLCDFVLILLFDKGILMFLFNELLLFSQRVLYFLGQ